LVFHSFSVVHCEQINVATRQFQVPPKIYVHFIVLDGNDVFRHGSWQLSQLHFTLQLDLWIESVIYTQRKWRWATISPHWIECMAV